MSPAPGRCGLRRAVLVLVLVACACPVAYAGGFLFAESQQNPAIIVHPSNYDGTGGPLEVSVCIDETSESIDEIQTSVENAILRWNERDTASPNLFFGNDNNIPSGTVDFESVLLHELGHCVGLAHPNAATESGLDEPDRNYTKALPGADDTLNLNNGSDNIIGSADDMRGDDINLHWFEIGVNNPMLMPSVIDASTMSVDLADLPTGDNFVANADIAVADALGFPDTEAVMQQGTRTDEAQRVPAVDDITTLRLGMSGFDRDEGTADDYEPSLRFDGVAPAGACDIMIKLSGSALGNCQISATSSGAPPGHFVITSGNIVFGSATQIDWFFNQESAADLIFADGFEDP